MPTRSAPCTSCCWPGGSGPPPDGARSGAGPPRLPRTLVRMRRILAGIARGLPGNSAAHILIWFIKIFPRTGRIRLNCGNSTQEISKQDKLTNDIKI